MFLREPYLIEGSKRILPTFPKRLAKKAVKSLQRLGVTVKTNAIVTKVGDGYINLKTGEEIKKIEAKTILWAAGVKASVEGELLSQACGVKLDRVGRVFMDKYLTIAESKDIFVIGDLAHFEKENGELLPGVAPVAMQQGRYVAKSILAINCNKTLKGFNYLNKGNLAVIGRKAAIADFGFLRLSGWIAWTLWLFIHILYLIEYDNKLKVMLEWAWNFFTRKKGARLITKMDF